MNTYPARKKFDSPWIGAAAGLTAPMATLYCFYLVRYSHVSFDHFFTKILMAHNILTPAISLCVIINLLVFFIFIWTHRNYSARGVLMATFVYAGYVVYQKYVK